MNCKNFSFIFLSFTLLICRSLLTPSHDRKLHAGPAVAPENYRGGFASAGSAHRGDVCRDYSSAASLGVTFAVAEIVAILLVPPVYISCNDTHTDTHRQINCSSRKELFAYLVYPLKPLIS